ncbi:MAG: glycosyltransferase family 2 protein [candidate division Zixibacteria bacterium]|nr:glycosyltransferase family 2 protein [candidate division Zixibacteria bacterium]
MSIQIVIPAYNAAQTLPNLLSQVKKHLPNVLVVDDGSTDDTSEIARKAGATVIRLEKNRGKGNALRTGFKAALESGSTAVLTLDADGQHDPERIPEFLKLASPDALIIGCREARLEKMPFPRILSNKITSSMLSMLTGAKLRDSQSGYRLIGREILSKVELETDHFETESELLLKAARLGYLPQFLPIPTRYDGERSFMRPALDTVRFLRLLWRSFWW